MKKDIPAFPMDPSVSSELQGGMTLRDYFAAKAMAALVVKYGVIRYMDNIASDSYELADAMLAERDE